MSDRLKALRASLGFTTAAPAVAAAPASPAAAAEGAPAASADIITDAQLETAMKAASDDGFKAASERFGAVMASDSGKANPAGALAMLTDPDLFHLSAESVSAKLTTFAPPAAPAAAPAAPAAPGGVDADKIDAGTPKVDLTGQAPGQSGGRAPAAPGDGGIDVNAVQDKVFANLAAENARFGVTAR